MYGHSGVRKVAVSTGEVLETRKLKDTHFGEGLTRLNDTLYQV